MKRPPSKRTLELIVENFNLKFPLGTPVMLRKDSGEVRTAVAGVAFLLPRPPPATAGVC